MVEQKALGLVIVIVSTVLYIYYSIWMLFMPHMDEDHIFQTYFPDRIYGVMFPTLLAYVLISVTLTTTGMILIRDSQRLPQQVLLPTTNNSNSNSNTSSKSS